MEDRIIKDRIITDILKNVVTAGERNRKTALEKKEQTNDSLIKVIKPEILGDFLKKKKKININ